MIHTNRVSFTIWYRKIGISNGGSVSDAAANVNNSPNDGHVGAYIDDHGNQPSTEEENEDEDLWRRVVGEVVETTSGEVTFWYVFPHSEEG